MDSYRPRIWLRAFWGFNPEEAGYLGFTREGVVNRFLAEYQDGDLVLIYGAESPETERQHRGQVLGLLEIEPTRIRDVDAMHPDAITWKVSKGWQHRWTHAVPVKRAWRSMRKHGIQSAAPNTDWKNRGRVIASQAELMHEHDANFVWAWPVQEVSVYGQPPLNGGDGGEVSFEIAHSPTKGLKPVFGPRTSNYEDGPCYLYVMQFEGNLPDFLGSKQWEMIGKLLLKVGYSNDTNRRLSEINSGFPASAKARWKLRTQSKPFPDAESAKKAEDELKILFNDIGASQGGEFFLCDEKSVDSAFARIASQTAFKILSPKKIT